MSSHPQMGSIILYYGINSKSGSERTIKKRESFGSQKTIFSPKDTLLSKQTSRKGSGETFSSSDAFGNTTDTQKFKQIDSIYEEVYNPFDTSEQEQEQEDEDEECRDPIQQISLLNNKSLSPMHTLGQRKFSIFQKFNFNNSQQSIQPSEQSLPAASNFNTQKQTMDFSRKMSTLIPQSPSHKQNFNTRKLSNIIQKNNPQNLTIIIPKNECNSPVNSSKLRLHTDGSPTKGKDNRNSALFKLEQMINEDKVFFDKKNPDAQKNLKSLDTLKFSQDGLVSHKLKGNIRQNSILSRRQTITDQLNTPKSSLNQEGTQGFFLHPLQNKSSITDLLSNTLSPKPTFLNIPSNLSNQNFNQNIHSPSRRSSNNTMESKNQLDDNNFTQLYTIYNSPKKRKNTDFDKTILKRRQHQTRVYNEFEPRLKTFTKFGFKMLEKEENEYIRPFMKEFQANEPKGTMFVSDLWSDSNILKFLGNCKMIRDKLTLIKLAQKQQSRENLLKKINNSNQLYFSNGKISQQNMSTISTIMKLVYQDKQQGGNSSTIPTPRTPITKDRDSLLGQSAGILNRKEELNLINTIHMKESRRSQEKKNEMNFLKPFQSNTSINKRASVLLTMQDNLSTRLSKPKNEMPSQSKYDQFLKQQTTIYNKRNSIQKTKLNGLHQQAQSLFINNNNNSSKNQNNNNNNNNNNSSKDLFSTNQNKFKPIWGTKLNESISNDISMNLNMSRKVSSLFEPLLNLNNNSAKNQIKVMEWVDQIDTVIKDNDKIYEQLNKHIDKLQNVIIKRNDQNQISV